MASLSKKIENLSPIALQIILFSAIAILGGAYIFQYGFGYAPCQLCYYQRYPYMAIIALAGLATLLPLMGLKIKSGYLSNILLITALLLFVDAGIAGYHAGVEYKWWAGPSTCTLTVDLSGSIDDRLAQLMKAPIIRCDEIPWSLFGISMAGYNFLFALPLGIFAILSWNKTKP